MPVKSLLTLLMPKLTTSPRMMLLLLASAVFSVLVMPATLAPKSMIAFFLPSLDTAYIKEPALLGMVICNPPAVLTRLTVSM